MGAIGKMTGFLRALANDERIPKRDKAVLAGMTVYLASPLDLIPDFIPVLGYADDAIVLALALDYVFNVVPEEVILAHFPWKIERYRQVKRWSRWITWCVPGFVRRRLWAAVKTEDGA